jgi:ribosome-binding factor A
MNHDFDRSERVGDTILRELALLIQRELRDPRLGMVNVTAVKVAKDLKNARVFVTFVETTENKEILEQVLVLNRAAGYLRAELGKQMSMRVIPKLHFEFDESIFYGARMTKLIDEVRARETKQDD